jgi:hypothetical protein
VSYLLVYTFIFCFAVRDVADESFADLTKVQGLRGIYIASQISFSAGLSRVGPEHISTLITFDRGGEWRPLEAPLFDDEGQRIACKKVSLHSNRSADIYHFLLFMSRKEWLYGFLIFAFFRRTTVHCICRKGSLSCIL